MAKIKKAQVGKTVKAAPVRAKADATRVNKPAINTRPATKYKYVDRFVPIGKIPSSSDSANYRTGYKAGIRGGGAGLFSDLQVYAGAEEGRENYKKGSIKKEKAGGKVIKAKSGKQMLKRADGSVSQRGLWDNIRANKGSGKKPTAQMLKQEKKIKAKTKK